MFRTIGVGFSTLAVAALLTAAATGPARAGSGGRKNTAAVLGGVAAYELLKGNTTAGVIAGAGAVVANGKYQDARDDERRYGRYDHRRYDRSDYRYDRGRYDRSDYRYDRDRDRDRRDDRDDRYDRDRRYDDRGSYRYSDYDRRPNVYRDGRGYDGRDRSYYLDRDGRRRDGCEDDRGSHRR